MEKYLIDLEFFSNENGTWTPCEIIGTYQEKSFIIKTSTTSSTIASIENLRKITENKKHPFQNASIEYEVLPNQYITCRINSQRGKFYSISIKGKINNSTILTRESNLRYITSINLLSIINENFSNIILQVPNELSSSSWTTSENYMDMLKSFDDDNVNGICFFHNLFPENSPSKIRILCLKDKAESIKMITETSIENEIKLCHISNDKSKTQREIEDVQKKNKIMTVNRKFVGMIIGTQGSNIKNLKKKYNVNIIINSKYKNENNEALITISGDNEKDVESCAKEMNLIERIFEIKLGQEYHLKKMSSKLMSQYSLKTFYISNKEVQDENGNYYNAPNLSLLGPEESITNVMQEIGYYIITK